MIRAVLDLDPTRRLALGATKWQVVWRQVLPASILGMATGSILALSRAVGETAADHGGRDRLRGLDPTLLGLHTALPVQIYNWTKQPDPTFQTSPRRPARIVLLVIVLGMNAVAIFAPHRYRRRW